MSVRVRAFLPVSFAIAFVLVLAGSPAHAAMSTGMRLGAVAASIVSDVGDTPGPIVAARVDLSTQTMQIYVGDDLVHVFPVSTARAGYVTPVGDYQAEWIAPRWRSRKYNMAPMPWAVFFHNGYAIHGTTEVSRLGKPASHGCVRLHPDNAKIFFQLVQASGLDSTRISIVR